MFLSVPELYQRDVLAGLIQADESQQPVINLLEQLNRSLQVTGEVYRRAAWWARLGVGQSKPAYIPVKGLYLWGSVGRGKTYLMDLFFEASGGVDEITPFSSI